MCCCRWITKRPISINREECKDVPVDVPVQVPREVCEQVPKQKCDKIPKQVPKQIPEKKCDSYGHGHTHTPHYPTHGYPHH